MNVLILNVGSSSLKFQIIATDVEKISKNEDHRLCRGQVERIGGEAIVTVQTQDGGRQVSTAPLRDVSAALNHILRWLSSGRLGLSKVQSVADIHAVGHRIVHGGETFKESVLIDEEVLR